MNNKTMEKLRRRRARAKSREVMRRIERITQDLAAPLSTPSLPERLDITIEVPLADLLDEETAIQALQTGIEEGIRTANAAHR